MKAQKILISMMGTFLLCCPIPLMAQNLLNRVKNTTESKIDNVVGKTIDKTIDNVFDNPKDVQEKPVKEAPRNAGNEFLSSQEKNSDSDKLYKHFSFIPGESILYEESFVTALLGELPGNWNSSSSGNIVTTNKESTKWLNVINGIYLTGLDHKSFGENYTIEFDLLLNVVPQKGYYLPYFHFGAYASGDDAGDDNKFLTSHRINNSFEIMMEPSSDLSSKLTLRSFTNKNETFKSDRMENKFINERLKKIFHISIAVTRSRIQIWIDQHKVVDIPKAVNSHAAPINQLFFKTENSLGYDEGNFGYLISNIKVASGIKNIKSELLTTGRLSTSGIVFNTNSDQLLPYSYGIIEQVANAMLESPGLKIRITGHTDSDGKQKANLELSLRRASAVKNVLVKLYGIDPSWIEVEGKGDTEPIADNRTNEGKASNRRVEFIKISSR